MQTKILSKLDFPGDRVKNARTFLWGKALFAFFLPTAYLYIAQAHPHVFVDYSIKFVVTDTGIDGFHVLWRFDEMFSEGIVEDYDQNKNRRFEQEEQGRIYEEAFKNIREFGYFLKLFHGKTKLIVKEVDNFAAFLEGEHLTYSFYVPWSFELTKATDSATLWFEDPTMFIAMDPIKERVQAWSSDSIDVSISMKKKGYTKSILLSLTKKESK